MKLLSLLFLCFLSTAFGGSITAVFYPPGFLTNTGVSNTGHAYAVTKKENGQQMILSWQYYGLERNEEWNPNYITYTWDHIDDALIDRVNKNFGSGEYSIISNNCVHWMEWMFDETGIPYPNLRILGVPNPITGCKWLLELQGLPSTSVDTIIEDYVRDYLSQMGSKYIPFLTYTPTATHAPLQPPLSNQPLALEYEYDTNGALISLSDTSGHTTEFKYDEDKHLVEMRDEERGVTSYEYNDSHQLIKISFPDETIKEISYDSSNNPTTNVKHIE